MDSEGDYECVCGERCISVNDCEPIKEEKHIKVRCIEKDMQYLTEGKIYDVIKKDNLDYHIIDDSGEEYNWFHQWFEPVDEPTEEEYKEAAEEQKWEEEKDRKYQEEKEEDICKQIYGEDSEEQLEALNDVLNRKRCLYNLTDSINRNSCSEKPEVIEIPILRETMENLHKMYPSDEWRTEFKENNPEEQLHKKQHRKASVFFGDNEV